MPGPTFSIVIPAHNESRDIGPTCDALLRLTHETEIIFVDDGSTDDTVEVLQRYLARPSMKLLRQPSNRGQGAARNAGVRAATGDVVVFLDADVLVPPDLLQRLSVHYEHGADYVEVHSDVANASSVYARFFYAQQQHLHDSKGAVGWSQAFSCRRPLAVQAGLFPETFPAVGEDGEFVRRLENVSSRRVVDKSIVVSHVVPDTMSEFWKQWHGRGIGVPFFRHDTQHVSWPRLLAERTAASLWSVLLIATVLPVIWRAGAIASLSTRGWRDLPAFTALTVLQTVAHRTGEWRAIVRLGLRHGSRAR